MNTPDNAAALERLETKWRESAVGHDYEANNATFNETLLNCADELATLRATLAQPDALTSQPSGGGRTPNDLTFGPQTLEELRSELEADAQQPPSGEAVAWRVANHPSGPFALRKTMPSGWAVIEPLFTHPSADAPGVAVDEVLRGVCMRMLTFENSEHVPNVMFQQLRAALAPKPEGGHG